MEKSGQKNDQEVSGDELKLITCVVQRGKADKLTKAAIEAGASGATVFFARGMGVRERLGLLGLAIVPEKEVVMIVCTKEKVRTIVDTLVKAGSLDTPGYGIVYVTAIDQAVGFIS